MATSQCALGIVSHGTSAKLCISETSGGVWDDNCTSALDFNYLLWPRYIVESKIVKRGDVGPLSGESSAYVHFVNVGIYCLQLSTRLWDATKKLLT